MQYMTSWERRAMDKGHKEGHQEGRQVQTLHLLMRVLKQRFQNLPRGVEARLQGLSVAQLENLMDNALGAVSLERWVSQLPPQDPKPSRQARSTSKKKWRQPSEKLSP